MSGKADSVILWSPLLFRFPPVIPPTPPTPVYELSNTQFTATRNGMVVISIIQPVPKFTHGRSCHYRPAIGRKKVIKQIPR